MGVSCTRPVAKVGPQEEKTMYTDTDEIRKEKQNMIRVGKPAPSFTAPAFYNGEFTEISLEDYKGQWVMLCFYPGDFTFV